MDPAEVRRLRWAAERWFWGTALACLFPLAVFGGLTGLGAGVCAATGPAGGCAPWPLAVPDLLDRLVGAAVVVGLAWPPVRTVASAIRRFRATRSSHELLRVAATEVADPEARRCIEEVGLGGRVRVVTHAAVGAWTVGVGRPTVLLTTALLHALEPEQLRAVLLHERCHLRRGDPFRALVIGALGDGFGWIPAVWSSSRRYLVLRELSADGEAALRAGRSSLVEALARCGHPVPGAPTPGPAFTDLGELRLAALTRINPRLRHPGLWPAWSLTAALAAAAWALAAAVCTAGH